MSSPPKSTDILKIRKPKEKKPTMVDSDMQTDIYVSPATDDMIYPSSLVIGSEFNDVSRYETKDVLIQNLPNAGYVALAEEVPLGGQEPQFNTFEKLPDIEYNESKPKIDIMTTLYVASLTVVGLFLAYRVLLKRK